MRPAFMLTAMFSLIFGLALGGCGEERDGTTSIEGHGSTFDEAVDDVAGRLANAFSEEGLSLPGYTLVEWQSIPAGELPPDAVAEGVQAGAVLNFEGATAMDPMAFRNLLATFLVFHTSSQAEDFYESFQDKALSHSNIAVEEFEISGAGIPTSAAQCVADQSSTAGLTCLVLEEEHKVVNLLLYANGPAVESAFGSPVLASAGDLQLTDDERWYIKSFEHDAFYFSVTTLNQAFHRYVNQTLEN